MVIRRYDPSLLASSLALLRRSESTPRTPSTWKANRLRAVIAFESKRPIGILPLEPRLFKISGTKTIRALWVSGAHVDGPFRSRGIGRAMDAAITRMYPYAQAVFAYRHDPSSRAYQWYHRQGYRPLCPIVSFKKKVVAPRGRIKFEVLSSPRSIQALGPSLLRVFQKMTGKAGGYPERSAGFWGHVRKHHYYKKLYKYFLLIIKNKTQLQNYALVGETTMKDKIPRFDILEMSDPLMLGPVMQFARQRTLREVRIQCAAHDPWARIYRNQGFQERWRTFILGKSLHPGSFEGGDLKSWKYFHVDYI